MKTIGLIAGMSWESSMEYYRIINERINHKLGGIHSAKIIMLSIDFWELRQLTTQNKWDEAAKMMIDATKKLELSGTDLLLICSNAMHKVADTVQKNIKIPLIHITDKTAEKIVDAGIKKVGLLGTKLTMEENFYRGRLKCQYNIDAFVPDEKDRDAIQEIIFKELCLGLIKNESKKRLETIIDSLREQGAEAVILGCTELTLLVKQDNSSLPIFDTTRIHAEAAADYALTY